MTSVDRLDPEKGARIAIRQNVEESVGALSHVADPLL